MRFWQKALGVRTCAENFLHLGPVHTNPFSNENGAVLLRIQLSSTLQRRKRSPKTEPSENAVQSGAIWKRCFLAWTEKTMCYLKRWRHHIDTTGRQTTRPWVSKMADRRYYVGLSLDRRCSVDVRKRYENDNCGRKSFWKRRTQLRFRLKTD